MIGTIPIPALTAAEHEAVAAMLAGGPAPRLERPPGSAPAALAWGLHTAFPRAWVWVTDGPRALDAFQRDLCALAGPERTKPAVFQALETLAGATQAPDIEGEGERLDTLRRLRDSADPPVVVTCIQALMQPTLAPDELERHRLDLSPGLTMTPAALAAHLQSAGYEFVPLVQSRGEASARGGIVDAWPPHAEWPLRVEFGETGVESLRAFDPDNQRTRGRLSAATLTPAHETPRGGGARLADHLPPGAVWAWVEPERLREHAHIYACAAREAGRPAPPVFDDLRAGARAGVDVVGPGEAGDAPLPSRWRPLDGVPDPAGARRGGWIEPDRLDAQRAAFVEGLMAAAGPERAVHFFFDTDGARDRFAERFMPSRAPPRGVTLHRGALGEGFAHADGAFTAVAEGDLYGRRIETPAGRAAARRRKPTAGPRLSDWAGIEPGELVVHVEHGIGRYLGLYEIVFNGQPQEVLAVQYADAAKLYIPVGQAHLLSRYIGFGRLQPDLHRLGGGRWARDKQSVERAIRDLAAQLLETQAVRQTRPGHAFPPDNPWQREFEAAFPYVETDDQARAADDIKRDMESPRPMDRLLCGDVGFGKTEVAMRAAFKAALGGKQVAVLVPTTVLAQQHYDTFTTRMAAFPVTVEMLSRFRTRGEQADVLRRVAAGQVDIVIGTHRLIQPDVRFKDLGLVVLDEEQRFGVAHKEALKALRATVDILTLTATPIPRTLYLSLTGARDLSVIQTAPRERLPIETIVAPYDDATIREAILRELNREGQVFYLHNRVQTIHDARDRLRRFVPEARVELAHGQMGEGELADIMHAFSRGAFDVLLCTTIIESGVDIPNVNTILIERADRFGLADLYQLRGRVGRYKHRAYAYLLLPRHGRLFDTARQRIHALRRHSGLGSGFRLALRDLETRGAGNLLGSEQSGHIQAVGFDLYCQLLRRTVAQLQGKAPPAVVEVRLQLDFLELSPARADADRGAVLPESYIEDETQRLDAYRRLAAASAEREVRALAAEWRDRYGPLPAMAGRLLLAARIRIRAQARGVDSVATDGDKLILSKRGELIQPHGRFPRLRAADATGRLEEILKFLSHA